MSMDGLIYWLARIFVTLVQALPLRGVARLGRWGGAVAFRLDGRHRAVAIRNLTRCFPEKPPLEIRELARENFRRLGENYLGALKTASMTAGELGPHFRFNGAEKLLAPGATNAGPPRSRVVAIGHFGNFELYARFGQFVPQFQCATTYRALRQPGLNRLLQELRERSGCRFFERRTEAELLKTSMREAGLILGLLADQHSSLGSVRLPFFGHECSTNAAAAVFALRYECPLHTAVCYRTALAEWQVEIGPEIPTRRNGQPRAVAEIMAEVNRAFEAAIRRDPANWFWVHNRWKPVKGAGLRMGRS